jgi:hypothetical protein
MNSTTPVVELEKHKRLQPSQIPKFSLHQGRIGPTENLDF